MMDSPLLSRDNNNSSAINADSALYIYPFDTGSTAPSATKNRRQMVVPTGGTIKKLSIKLSSAPGTGKTRVFALNLNGTDSALTVTISDTATSGQDNSHSVTVAAGDLITISSTGTGTAASTGYQITMIFTGSTANESILFGTTGDTAVALGTSNMMLQGASLPASSAYGVSGSAGSIKKLYVNMLTAPGVPRTRSFTAVINGSNSTLTCTVATGTTTANDTTHNPSVSAGDKLSITSSSLAIASSFVSWSCVFVATTDGESLLMANNQSDNLYFSPADGQNAYATQAPAQQMLPACTLKNFYFNGTNSGTARTITVEQNGSGTSLAVTITGVATANDTSDSVTVADTDLIDYKISSTGLTLGNGLGMTVSITTAPVTTTQTINSDTDIKATTTHTINSDTDIKGTTTRTINSDTTVLKTETQTINSDTDIQNTTVRTILSDTDIQNTTVQTILSDTEVTLLTQQTILSDADVQNTTTRTINSDAEVLVVQTKTIFSDTTILKTQTKTILSDADIKNTTTRTISSDADIKNTTTRTILSDTDIKGTTTRTITAACEVVLEYDPTITSDAIIFVPFTVESDISFENDKMKDTEAHISIAAPSIVTPSGLTATNTGTGDSIRLSWSGTGPFFNVYLVTAGPVYTRVNSFPIADNFYVVGGLVPGTPYRFIVRSTDGR